MKHCETMPECVHLPNPRNILYANGSTVNHSGLTFMQLQHYCINIAEMNSFCVATSVASLCAKLTIHTEYFHMNSVQNIEFIHSSQDFAIPQLTKCYCNAYSKQQPASS